LVHRVSIRSSDRDRLADSESVSPPPERSADLCPLNATGAARRHSLRDSAPPLVVLACFVVPSFSFPFHRRCNRGIPSPHTKYRRIACACQQDNFGEGFMSGTKLGSRICPGNASAICARLQRWSCLRRGVCSTHLRFVGCSSRLAANLQLLVREQSCLAVLLRALIAT
jgi:hypothetical protein